MEVTVKYDTTLSVLGQYSHSIDQRTISMVIGNETTFVGDTSFVFELCIFSSKEPPVTAELPCTSKKANTTSGELKWKVNNVKMFDDPSTSDFTFYIGNDRKDSISDHRFRVDQAKLAAVSPIFRKTFTDFSKKKFSSSTLNDIKAADFKMLLRFIYDGDIPTELSEAIRLYRVAHKYEIEELKVICKPIIHNKLRPETAVDVFDWGCSYNLEDVKLEAWTIIKRYTNSD